jgi:hypothetical protein
MFRFIINTITIPGLQSRILFTLGLLAICRLMAWISF